MCLIDMALSLRSGRRQKTFYPLSETITFGIGGKKKLNVILPVEIWWQRALTWVHGLDVMERLLIDEDDI